MKNITVIYKKRNNFGSRIRKVFASMEEAIAFDISEGQHLLGEVFDVVRTARKPRLVLAKPNPSNPYASPWGCHTMGETVKSSILKD